MNFVLSCLHHNQSKSKTTESATSALARQEKIYVQYNSLTPDQGKGFQDIEYVEFAKKDQIPFGSAPKREDKVYAERFRHLQEGRALWPRVTSNEMSPGVCGYFNGEGDWVPVVHLTDIEAVRTILESRTPKRASLIAHRLKNCLNLSDVPPALAAGSHWVLRSYKT